MIKIAHLSDLHFGRHFKLRTWERVRLRIKECEPNFIVASGDFVDTPALLDLLAAKTELLDLCKKCTSKPELIVVPGNHDVATNGNRPSLMRRHWFDRIMFGDTSTLRDEIQTRYRIELGLNKATLKLCLERARVRHTTPDCCLLRKVPKASCDSRKRSCDYHGRGGNWPTLVQHNRVLFACINSNPKGRFVSRLSAIAAGEIDAEQIEDIDASPRTSACPYCNPHSCTKSQPHTPTQAAFKVAVLHHHPLPIALTDEPLAYRNKERSREQFFILRDGGELLHTLQSQNFDMVLHGHKHRPQLARVELYPTDSTTNQLFVLAGGSCARANEANIHNTLRIIKTEACGQLRTDR